MKQFKLVLFLFSSLSLVACSPDTEMDALYFGYVDRAAERGREASRQNLSKVVPAEREILEKLYDWYRPANYGGDSGAVWTSIAPFKDEDGEERFYTTFLSLGEEFPIPFYASYEIGGCLQTNRIETKDIQQFKHLRGLSFASVGHGGIKREIGMDKRGRYIYEFYENINLEAIGRLPELKYFRPPDGVTDDELRTMKNIDQIEVLNLRGCYDIRGKFCNLFGYNSSLQVLKISQLTLLTMDAVYLSHLSTLDTFRHIELSGDHTPNKIKIIRKEDIQEWLRGPW